MPALTLQVVSIDAAPVGQPTLHAFGDSGGSIGRDETNFLALPDKHRRVSRLHATISFPGGMPTITNSSTSLPLSVGEQQLDGGQSMPISQGVLIEIGPYVLQAHVGTMSPSAPLSATPAQAVRRDAQPTGMPASMLAANDRLAADPLLSWPVGNQSAASSLLLPPSASSSVIGLGEFWPSHDQSSAALSPLMPTSLSTDFSASASPPSPARAALTALPAQQFVSANASDPFADLLAGIGGSPAPQQHGIAPRDSAPIATTQAGISADPLAAFGGGGGGGGMSSTSLPANTLLGGFSVQPRQRASAPDGRIPDDFNPFHMPSSAARNTADPLADLIGGSPTVGGNASAESTGTPSIDSLFQSGGSGSSDAALFGFEPAGRGGDGTIAGLIRSDAASDPLSLFDSIEPPPAPLGRPMRDNSMEVGSAFTPPLASMPDMPDRSNQSSFPAAFAMAASLPVNALAAPVPAYALAPPAAAPYLPPTASAPVVAARPVAAASAFSAAQAQPAAMPIAAASSDALTEAFLRGAGLAASALPHGLTPEIMTIIGSLLRSATAGAVDMLAARAATKREVQASVTIISVQANNPLKFLPNADAALLQLLGKKMPGFMRADVAMRDAFDDLRAHEVGVIAGTRAALTEVLGKFDPATLGDKLAKGSVLESLMPSARKAKLWDLYLERYLQIRREAEDDFQSIFGRAFVQAYERETARIKGESPMAGGE